MGSFPEQPSCEVEEVNHLITELASGHFDIADGRGLRAARGEKNHFGRAHPTLAKRVVNRAMAWVKTAIEADGDRHAGFLDLAQAVIDALDVQIDRLFTEDRFSGLGRSRQQLSMRISGRGNEDRVHLGIGQRAGHIRSNLRAIFFFPPPAVPLPRRGPPHSTGLPWGSWRYWQHGRNRSTRHRIGRTLSRGVTPLTLSSSHADLIQDQGWSAASWFHCKSRSECRAS